MTALRLGRLVLRMARSRLRSQLASAGIVAAGTALLTAFAGLADTGLALGSGAGDDAGSLLIVAGVLGAWTTAIVAFALASSVSLGISQRLPEVALLRSTAATPRQLRALVLGETVLVTVPAVVVGVLPGVALSAVLLDRLTAAGLLPTAPPLHVGAITVGVGTGLSVLMVLLASWLAARSASRISPVRAMAAARGVPAAGRRGRAGRVAAIGCLVVGVGTGVTAMFMPDAVTRMASAGPACVFVAIGLALLAPGVVRRAGRTATRPLGAVGRLAGRNLGGRAGAVVGPLVLLVGVSTGTLYMQNIHTAALVGTATPIDVKMAAVNYLIVAMIVMFAAVAVYNTLTTVTRGRTREFGLLRVTAATPRQVIRMVCGEAAVTALVAVVLGTIAAAATLVPYSMVKVGSPIPSGGPWIYLGVVAATFAIAVAATVPTTRSSIRPAAITVLAG